MRLYRLDTGTWLRKPLAEVFAFFADAGNLETLTPPWLRFELITRTPIDMAPGTMIDYRLRLFGLPVRWRSEITAWEPPVRFVDEQRRGPYRLWRHTHTFAAEDGGTRVEDHVEFSALGGAIVNEWIVARDLRRIFSYRHHQLDRLFGGNLGAVQIVIAPIN